jgi:mannitol/fructose-specific phosphotransferase system IIA component (Ntr-type)
MSILSTSLLPKDVLLQLRATDHRDALEEVLSSLRSDHRVKDWEKLRASLLVNSENETFKECPGTLFLHHGRTESVSSLVLAVGRSAAGFSQNLEGEKTRLLFIAAIPEAMNNEYLRILGAISRVCREKETLKMLLNVEKGDLFLAALEKGCCQ